MNKKQLTEQAYKTWSENKTPDNMSSLLGSLSGTINSVSATHGASGDENLKWAIRLHLAKEIKNRYDPSKSALSTFVYQSLQRIPRMAAQQRNIVHVPESSDADMRRIAVVRQELIDKNERDPSDDEIADRSGISSDRVRSLNSKFGRPKVTMSKFHATSGGAEPNTIGLDTQTVQEDLYQRYAVDSLAPQDRQVYDWLSQEVPLAKSQIATRLGISPPAVSQRIDKINKMLEHPR